MEQPLERVKQIFEQLECVDGSGTRTMSDGYPHHASPMPASTSAKRCRSPAGSTTCASPARSCFPQSARWHRHHAVRGREERAAGRTVRDAQEPDAGILAHRHAARFAPSSARRAATSWMSRARRSCSAFRKTRSLSDHAQRARHRVPDGSSPSVAAQPPAARHHCACGTK